MVNHKDCLPDDCPYAPRSHQILAEKLGNLETNVDIVAVALFETVVGQQSLRRQRQLLHSPKTFDQVQQDAVVVVVRSALDYTLLLRLQLLLPMNQHHRTEHEEDE